MLVPLKEEEKNWGNTSVLVPISIILFFIYLKFIWETVASIYALLPQIPAVIIAGVLAFSVIFPGFIVLVHWLLVPTTGTLWFLFSTYFLDVMIKRTSKKNILLFIGTLPYFILFYLIPQTFESTKTYLSILLGLYVLLLFVRSLYSLWLLVLTYTLSERVLDYDKRKKEIESELSVTNMFKKIFLKEEIKALDSVIRSREREKRRKIDKINKKLKRLDSCKEAKITERYTFKSIGDDYFSISDFQNALENYIKSYNLEERLNEKLLNKILTTREKLGLGDDAGLNAIKQQTEILRGKGNARKNNTQKMGHKLRR